MDNTIEITSQSHLIDIEHPFRVSAGPGAGKTRWLINHIKNVLTRSNRLGKMRKVACITYTNTATETILERLDRNANRVEISTIHSFLYRNVVKPYADFIDSQYNLNIEKMDGHDDIVLSNYSFLQEWKSRTKQNIDNKSDNKVTEAFRQIQWKFENNTLHPRHPRRGFKVDFFSKGKKPQKYNIRNDSYIEYKKMCWEKGIIHHDDVLFFSYHLIETQPFILEILRSKFPYFFVDEFQDTNPIQAKILERIGQKETIVGVIGDKAQSIYGFQGADPSQFSDFTLPNLVDYQIKDNHRSTIQIIDILNHVRVDLVQHSVNRKTGNSPTIVIGTREEIKAKAQAFCGDETIHFLTRKNVTTNALKFNTMGLLNNKLFDELKSIDSNSDRRRYIIASIYAIELARIGKFKEAIKKLEKQISEVNKVERKKKALKQLMTLLKEYDNYKDGSFLEFNHFIVDNIHTIPKVRSGRVKTFYEGYTYSSFAINVNTEDTSLFRTIHKAKGAEFNNVVLVLDRDKDGNFDENSELSFLLNPNLDGIEEHRINYVAISRAKQNLLIGVPTLSDANRIVLGGLGFQFI